MWLGGGGGGHVGGVPRSSLSRVCPPADIITLLPGTLTHPGHRVCSESPSRPYTSPSFGSLLASRTPSCPRHFHHVFVPPVPPALLTGRGRLFTPVPVLCGWKCDLCVVGNIWNDPESDRPERVQMLLPRAPQINNKHVFTEIKSFISNINESDSNFSCGLEITLRQINQWQRGDPETAARELRPARRPFVSAGRRER